MYHVLQQNYLDILIQNGSEYGMAIFLLLFVSREVNVTGNVHMDYITMSTNC
jgi:hypothetical protein